MSKLKLFTMSAGAFICGSCIASGCCQSCCPGGCCPKTPKAKAAQPKQEQAVSKDQQIKQAIKDAYSKVVESNNTSTDTCAVGACSCAGGCCGGGEDLSKYLGYSKEELESVAGANLGLGCGHPVSLGEIKEGQTVLDLGSGAGIDCLLAAKKVGLTGKVIGVDMTQSMINKARENAAKYNANNVEFRLGDIEELPVSDSTVDIIISNCVINLATDKQKVFNESWRVLKTGGSMYVSDVILLAPLTKEQQNDTQLLCACIGGALLKDDYINKMQKSGFAIKIVDEDTTICQKWFGHNDLPIASLKFIATKQ